MGGLIWVSCMFEYIFARFLINYNWLAPMDENGAIGDGFVIASIKSSSTLVSASLFHTPGILL